MSKIEINFPLSIYKDNDGELSTKENPIIDQVEFILGIQTRESIDIKSESGYILSTVFNPVLKVTYCHLMSDKYLTKEEIFKML